MFVDDARDERDDAQKKKFRFRVKIILSAFITMPLTLGFPRWTKSQNILATMSTRRAIDGRGGGWLSGLSPRDRTIDNYNVIRSNLLSIPVFPKLWDTELLCTQYARNYWLTRVPVDSSHRHLSVDRRWNYLARVLVDSSPRRLSVDRHWNYLARVPVVYPSTYAETVDSHPSKLSFGRRNL